MLITIHCQTKPSWFWSILIEDFADEIKKQYEGDDGMYPDVCKWSDVTCDADESVVSMEIDSQKVNGSIDVCNVPPKVKVREMQPTQGKSKLTGSVDLTGLSGEIEYVCLDINRLTGEVDLTRLPRGMVHLSLPDNRFTGEIDLTQLPDEMGHLYLSFNQLNGLLFMWNLPPKMISIDLQGNFFNAIAVVNAEIHSKIHLQGSGVTAVVDRNGEKLDSERFFE